MVEMVVLNSNLRTPHLGLEHQCQLEIYKNSPAPGALECNAFLLSC